MTWIIWQFLILMKYWRNKQKKKRCFLIRSQMWPQISYFWWYKQNFFNYFVAILHARSGFCFTQSWTFVSTFVRNLIINRNLFTFFPLLHHAMHFMRKFLISRGDEAKLLVNICWTIGAWLIFIFQTFLKWSKIVQFHFRQRNLHLIRQKKTFDYNSGNLCVEPSTASI